MKLVLLTGATSGIGKAAAFELARRKYALVLVARDPERGTKVIEEIRKDTGNSNLELLKADLSSRESIRDAANQFLQKHSALDVLINNAGTAVRQRLLTPDGIETTFAVNHLAYFLLTNLLLDRIQAAVPSRIINVSSEAHRHVQFDPENLQSEKKFSSFGAYSITKFCNVLFTYELAGRLKGTGVTVNALHPGFLNTEIFRNAGGLLRWLVRRTAKAPEIGAQAIVRLATDPELENVTGKYYNGLKMVNSSPGSYDQQAAKQLWEISEKLVKL